MLVFRRGGGSEGVLTTPATQQLGMIVAMQALTNLKTYLLGGVKLLSEAACVVLVVGACAPQQVGSPKQSDLPKPNEVLVVDKYGPPVLEIPDRLRMLRQDYDGEPELDPYDSFAYWGTTRPDSGKQVKATRRHVPRICSDSKCAHGFGSILTDWSIWYKGDFVDGYFHGIGFFEDDFILYVGGFENGEFHGYGEFKCLIDAALYKGAFRNGVLVGEFDVMYEGGRKGSRAFAGDKYPQEVCWETPRRFKWRLLN